MGHDNKSIRRDVKVVNNETVSHEGRNEDFVLDKSIFSNIFEKDIRRVFIYKKAERIAKAICLIAPSFANSLSFRNRFEGIAVGLISASTCPLPLARQKLSHELLTLSSMLSVLRTSGTLSQMNADLISREATVLLNEVSSYEEPQLSFGEAPTLSSLTKRVSALRISHSLGGGGARKRGEAISPGARSATSTGQRSQVRVTDRREAIVSIIKDKKTVNIKDISVILKDISEKTVQRELIALINSGVVIRKGERRWSSYSLA